MVRDTKGRFVKGHENIGAGRKSVSYEQQLLKAAFNAISVDGVNKVMQRLEKMAMAGNIAAMKLYLSYAIGEPTQKHEVTGANGDVIRVTLIGEDGD